MLNSLLFVLLIGLAQMVNAQTNSSYKEVKAALQTWSFDSDKNFTSTPVYYGGIHRVGSTKLSQCLTLAFIEIKDGKLQYAHKIWRPKAGKCGFDDMETKDVDPQFRSRCLNDSKIDPTSQFTNRQMDNTNIDYFSITGNNKGTVYRAVDMNTNEASQFADCDGDPQGNRIDDILVLSVKNGRFVMETDKGWAYDVSLNAVDTSDGVSPLPTAATEAQYTIPQ